MTETGAATAPVQPWYAEQTPHTMEANNTIGHGKTWQGEGRGTRTTQMTRMAPDQIRGEGRAG